MNIDLDTVLYEEPGWTLRPVFPAHDGRRRIKSAIHHNCTQRIDCQSEGRYSGQRKWVDEESEYHWIAIANKRQLNTACWRCGFRASAELQGLWLLHNWDMR